MGDEQVLDEEHDELVLGDEWEPDGEQAQHDDQPCDAEQWEQHGVHDHAPDDVPCGQHGVCHGQLLHD